MQISRQIDSMILELTRKGLRPRYIVVGNDQYRRWIGEFEFSSLEVENTYQGCDIVICGSDIIEVVPEPRALYEYLKRNSKIK